MSELTRALGYDAFSILQHDGDPESYESDRRSMDALEKAFAKTLRRHGKDHKARADEAVRLLNAVLRESDRDTIAYREARAFLAAQK